MNLNIEETYQPSLVRKDELLATIALLRLSIENFPNGWCSYYWGDIFGQGILMLG